MAKGLGFSKKNKTYVSNSVGATSFGGKSVTGGKPPFPNERPNADRDAYRENYRREMQRRKRRVIA